VLPLALVGRDRELEHLEAGLAALSARRGGVFFVVGEPGIGKSRLAAEAADRATARGFRVVWGRCWEAAGAPAFWPWIQVLRTLAKGGEVLGELARLLPESGTSREPVSVDRFEVFDALGQLLSGAAGRQPLVLVFEDLHTADQASLSALEFVVRHTRDAQLLVVGTYRNVGATPAPDATALLERAARSGIVLPLQRLSERDVAALVDTHGTDAATAQAVYQATEGNPLFVHEVLRVLSALGPAAQRVPVPSGIRAVIREHVRLAGGADESLELAAILGREFGLTTLAAALEREPLSVAESLAPAVRAGLLGEPYPRQYRFTHVLIRDTLYEDIAPARRAELHRAAGERLAQLYGDDPGAPLDEIAHHYFEAGLDVIDKAIEASRRAAERAIRMFAFEEAALGLERALHALERAAPSDARRRAELLIELGRARIACGDSEAGMAACRQAAELARGLRSSELLARAALTFGQVFTFGVPGDELTALLEQAIAALGTEETPLLARAMARLAGALQPAPTPDRPVALAREAIALARRLGDDDTLLYVLHAAGSALFNVVEPSECIPLHGELVRLAAAHGDIATVLHAHARLFTDFLNLGDVAAADAELARYEQVVSRLKQPRYHWPVALMHAARAQMEGRFSDCERGLDEARRLALAAGVPHPLLATSASMAVAERQRGKLELALPPEVMPVFTPIPGAAALFGIPRVPGQESRVASAFLAAPEDSLAGWARHWTAFGIWLADMALFVGDRALVAKVYGWLLPSAGRTGTWAGAGMCCEGPVARWLCRLAARLERWDDAERHHRDALTCATRMGMRPCVAQLKCEWAGELMLRGRRDEALALLEQARALAEELGMHEFVARLAAQHREPASVLRMVAEGDVWLVEGEGERCRVKDSRGMQMLAALIGSPERELHCLELGGGAGASGEAIDLGTAGAALDREALDQYRSRLRELRAELDEAEACHDAGRAARAREEVECLERELTRAVGLGGRERKQGSATERARINVQRRLKLAIAHIEELAPALGRRLSETIRTGTFCAFEPRHSSSHR
jgi:tetratricopeptide (TPR) repeat protein